MEETQLSKDFKAAAIRWLNFRLPLGFEAREITSWDEDTYANIGCPTCGPETVTEVLVYYVDVAGRSGHYTYDGTFTNILQGILNA